ncbi:hypothetical protein H0H87_004307, partial [Tephrocybe sp. NHM501043]
DGKKRVPLSTAADAPSASQQQQQHWSVAPPLLSPVPSQPREKQQKRPIGDGEDEMENETDDELDDAGNDVDLGVEEYED